MDGRNIIEIVMAPYLKVDDGLTAEDRRHNREFARRYLIKNRRKIEAKIRRPIDWRALNI